MTIYRAVRACLMHDAQLGSIEADGNPLENVASELVEKGGPQAYHTSAIIFPPKDGSCGEVFVLVPPEMDAVFDELIAIRAIEKVLTKATKKQRN